MLTAKEIDPPLQLKNGQMGEWSIGVRILIAPGLDTLVFGGGEQNRVGTEMLCRLLQARMELAGMRVTEVSRGLPLNRAAFMFSASELAPALECIKGELEKLWLLRCAQIAWRDSREEVWRVWHSQSGRFEWPSDEQFEAEKDLLAYIRRALEKFQQPRNASASQ